ncbi:diacylglycerol kinase [Rhizobium oryziradicis]|uniref:Diacylglycerol kinase n=1 Tax=Rhizobium oryziradicis TaxID=1867956 RepID=A0A1Q8ZRC2_9HYPH|nr:diacylglycerol kinase [Rhizobium oryziradicis]OLP44606.1 diacylglycerol kinase [Rhizobium oryziradicis]
MEAPNPAPFSKKTGFAHLWAATRYSLQGFRRLLAESAFRHELILLAAAFGLFVYCHATMLHYLGLIVLGLMLIAVEALNTAIEEVIDRISPEFSDVARNAKDLGSFAVSCLLLATLMYVGWVVFFANL